MKREASEENPEMWGQVLQSRIVVMQDATPSTTAPSTKRLIYDLPWEKASVYAKPKDNVRSFSTVGI
jgi:hypothetical protein